MPSSWCFWPSSPRRPAMLPRSRSTRSCSTRRWAASWIRHAGARGRDMGVYLFREAFDLPAAPWRFVVHASADQRYELFVNGARVATGPARGDLDHWRFETVDIATQLRAGPQRARGDRLELRRRSADGADQQPDRLPPAGRRRRGGRGEHRTRPGSRLRTRRSRCCPSTVQSIVHEYFVGGPGEKWWTRAVIRGAGSGRTSTTAAGPPPSRSRPAAREAMRDTPSRWFLVPRGIPLMEDTPERLATVARRTSGGEVPAGVLQGTARLDDSRRTRR